MGKRSWLNKLLEEKLLPLLAELSLCDEGIAKAQELHSWLRCIWAERGFIELNQQQSLMDQTRRAIKDKLGDTHFTLEYIDFNKDEYIRLNDSKQRSVAQRNEDVKQIDKPSQIVATAVQLLDSQEWADVAAGLAVLTGRRSSELLSTARFEVKTLYSVTFTGALKRGGETQTLCFEIPTLTDSEKVCSALAKIRHQLPDAQHLSAQQVNSRYGTAVMNACDRHFVDLVPAREGGNLYTHLFRAVYATIATFWYCPAKVDPVEFRAAIQGHYAVLDAKNPSLRRSLTASRHYSDFEIADSVIAQHGGKRKGIKLGINGVEPLEVFKPAIIETQTVPSKRKHHSSLRIWKEDRDSLAAVLQHFPANTQPDSVAAWIAWSLSSLQSLEEATARVKNTTQVDGPDEGGAQPTQALPDHTDSKPLTKPDLGKGKGSQNATDFDGVDHTQSTITQVQSNSESISDIQSTTTTTASNEPVSSGLEAKLDRLVEVMTQFIGLQIQQSTAGVPPQHKTRNRASGHKQTTTSRPSVAQPKSTYKTGIDDEVINAAIDAIIAHNNNQELHDLKWEITVNTLKAFSKNQRAIERILGKGKANPNVERIQGSREALIEQHHIQHGIGPGHNHRHKRKRKITDVIHISFNTSRLNR